MKLSGSTGAPSAQEALRALSVEDVLPEVDTITQPKTEDKEFEEVDVAEIREYGKGILETTEKDD